MIEPQQLFSMEAEQAVIGAMLINPNVMAEIDLPAGDFYLGKHRSIWGAAMMLEKAGVAVDIVTLSELLDRQGKLEEIGGAAALVAVISQTVTSMGADRYARIVKDYAARRRLLQAAQLAAKAAYDLETSTDESIPGIVDSVVNAVNVEGGAVHVSHFTRQLLDAVVERMNNPQSMDGVPTGFSEFDKVSMGLQPGEVLMITGEPGTGKSITCMQAALQMAQKNYPVACYALEMRGLAVVRRWASALSKIRVSAMRQGIEPAHLENITGAIEDIDRLPIYISDRPGISLGALRADLTRLQRLHDTRAFILDYDYLVSDGRGMSENDRTILISSQIKHICRDREMPGIIIHSMNKGGSTNALDVLRGSKQVAFDIDWLIVMRADATNPREIICTIEKGRELEEGKQGFKLLRLEGLPFVGQMAKASRIDLDHLPARYTE